jgi:osmotically-inducible protein OsmY
MKAAHSTALALAAAAFFGAARVSAATSDASIVASAKKSFVFRHFLKRDDVHVKSSDGVVTLTGTVSESSHKSLAEETVKTQSGVKSVDNELTVKTGGPAEHSDAWITAKVKSMLMFHRGVSAHGTKVETKDGVVTLRGHAESQAQKDLTAEYAKDVEDVKDVKNEIKVAVGSTTRRMEEKIDDSSITAEVKAALLFHRSTSALNTIVKTTNGVVTLGGTAKSTAEADLASRIVKDVRGVKDVNNRMTVSAQ